MPIITSSESERDGLMQAANLMLISARTAPKSGGIDDIVTAIVVGEEKDRLAETLDKIGEERNVKDFRRDAIGIRKSEIIVLLGVRGTKAYGSDCGGCGYATCAEYEAAEKKAGKDLVGPMCIFKLIDLGVALGSAAKTASILNVDNRMMFHIGIAAAQLNMLPEADIICGIPLSATGKNIYFDRYSYIPPHIWVPPAGLRSEEQASSTRPTQK